MKIIKRNSSVITAKHNLEKLFEIPNFPVFIGCTNKQAKTDLFANLTFNICRDSGIVQLGNLIPLEILYDEYHSEALGAIWADHHVEFLKFISKYKFKTVLEIGGSNGVLARSFLKQNKLKSLKWTILEPSPEVTISDKRVSIIKDYFPSESVANDCYDCVIHSHVLEHSYDPKKFIDEIGKKISKNGYHLFTLPNLRKYVENFQVNALNFEHTIFLTEDFIEYFLKYAGFEILEKKYYREHSIFYATQFNSNQGTPQVPNKYLENKHLFNDYFSKLFKLAEKFNNSISKSTTPAYIFGAHVFTQFFTKIGIDETHLSAVLDNSRQKQGKRLYGTKLHVQSLESISADEKPLVIVQAGQYQEEIKNQLKKINANVKILE